MAMAGYVALYQQRAQIELAAYISALEQRHRVLLEALPKDFQAKFHRRHRQAAAEPGACRLRPATCCPPHLALCMHHDMYRQQPCIIKTVRWPFCLRIV